MLLRLFFIFALSWTAFVSSSYSMSQDETEMQRLIETGNSYQGSNNDNTGSDNMTQEEQEAAHKKIMKNTKDLIDKAEGILEGCRKSKCSEKLDPRTDIITRKAIPAKECESKSNLCLAQKTELENLKKQLKNIKEAENDLENGKDDTVGNSALSQTRNQEKDTKLYAIIGVGTTAALGYKAKTTCARCCNGADSTCCPWCTGLWGMTALAAYQTISMIDKKKDLGDTGDGLCGGEKCPKNQESGQEPKYCPDGTPIKECLGAEKVVTTVPTGCPPDKPDCDNNSSTDDPNMRTNTDNGGLSSALTNIEDHLSDGFKPNSWPEEENPFSKTNPFNYETLSPKNKKKADKIMADLNKHQQAFMAQHGLGDDSDEESGATLDPQAKAEDVSPSFQKMADDGSRALAGLEEGPVRKKPTSEEQMIKDMLKNLYGGKAKGKKGLGVLGKPIPVGDELLGHPADDIFRMVHRMNRKLDKQGRFISSGSF